MDSEFLIRDVSDYLVFLLRYKSEVVSSIPSLLRNLIDWVVVFLNAPVLVKSPIIRAKLSATLSELVYKKNSEQSTSQRWTMQIGQQFGATFEESDMAKQNMAAGSERYHLILSGIMLIYCDLDVIEGLDVDQEQSFDKYSVRRSLAVLLNDLWELPSFQQSLKEEAKSRLFSNFISTVVNDSIHLLQDSLGRLVDIKQLQLAMSDTVEWSKQDNEIKHERERYYEIQERRYTP